jgi:hypothetical protein
MKMEQRTATTIAESNAYDMLRPAARGDMHVLCVRGVMWPVGAVWCADDQPEEGRERPSINHGEANRGGSVLNRTGKQTDCRYRRISTASATTLDIS